MGKKDCIQSTTKADDNNANHDIWLEEKKRHNIHISPIVLEYFQITCATLLHHTHSPEHRAGGTGTAAPKVGLRVALSSHPIVASPVCLMRDTVGRSQETRLDHFRYSRLRLYPAKMAIFQCLWRRFAKGDREVAVLAGNSHDFLSTGSCQRPSLRLVLRVYSRPLKQLAGSSRAWFGARGPLVTNRDTSSSPLALILACNRRRRNSTTLSTQMLA